MKVKGPEVPRYLVHNLPPKHMRVVLVGKTILLAPSYTYFRGLRVHVHGVGSFIEGTRV